MDITQSLIADRSSLIETLISRSKSEQQGAEHIGFTDFLSSYLETFSLEEWLGREIEDLYNACKGFYLFLEKRNSTENKVRVFNPNLDEDGWLCGRTVLLVACSDSPFIVDSLRIALQERQLPIHIVKSTVLQVSRDDNSKLVDCKLSRSSSVDKSRERSSDHSSISSEKEALVYFEISALNLAEERTLLKDDVQRVLIDVQSVVKSYRTVLTHLDKARASLAKLPKAIEEEKEFLEWLPQSHFTFLGYREYDLKPPAKGSIGDESLLVENIDARLGVFEKLPKEDNNLKFKNFSKGMKDFYSSDSALSFSKSATRSNVHRSVYPDYVVVKKLNENGALIGEQRFLGLYTYNVSTMSAMDIPILRKKAEYVIQKTGIDPESHDGRTLSRIIKDYPKDEIFQTNEVDLFKYISLIAAINERHITRLILRKDDFGGFVNCLVYVPRDLYTTEIRKEIESLIGKAINAIDHDTTTYFSESSLARAQIVFRVPSDAKIDVNIRDLEQQIEDISRDWIEHFSESLISSKGESRGAKYFKKYKNTFPENYQNDFDSRAALADIKMLETLSSESDIAMHFYQPIGYPEDQIKFKVMHLNSIIELSEVVPILENLGLRVLGEQPYKLLLSQNDRVWMHDFTLKFALPITLDISAVKSLFESAFESIWSKKSESDSFNRLILGARLPWREVNLLRAYANYLKQTTFSSSLDFIASTLVSYPEITRNILALFKAYFDPRLNKSETIDANKENLRCNRLEQKILSSLDEVANLNHDRVLRRYYDLIKASLRTNFFQKDSNGEEKNYLSIKFSPRKISGIPEPRPLYEIFVFSPRVEGVHLRGGKVSRGGLRWSDRYEDYRTEVLGLVKAQSVKNAVIVPDGAKGGFVAKQLPDGNDRKAKMDEGIACYKIFIQGLLDITDNLINGEVVIPEQVIRRDQDDPYLVVAADKGTATFSDIANAISNEYGHWLGDAFASGGSQGYDHKGMGITARGAWVSVQRHFRELGKDIQKEDFSVIGVGDMAGDVFGNGMLLSEHICLKAAFNHLHIFIDPTPNSKESFTERKRLFEHPQLNWSDYNKALISAGGGIFNRSDKSIKITKEMQSAFDISEKELSPNDFIHALLKAPVDLLWNGGIGTYIKSSDESHSEVGDKANDSLRVNGNELRCSVIGEGGNLGATQLGRVEFALNGGACNTDFIDNAAGVDCSDHEVNIKILIDEIVANGDLTSKQRNQLLVDMTESVSELVLQNNYRQTFAISVAKSQVASRMNEYRRFISHLESIGKLDRALEFLPTDEEIVERIGRGKVLVQPELSVLISYAKVQLKEALFSSDLASDDYIAMAAKTAFPSLIDQRYPEKIDQHRLRKEIVGTQIANDLINNLGITAAHRLSETTGASLSDIAKAYVVSRDVFEFESFQDYIKSLDNIVPASFQSELMGNMVRRVRRGTRWFLRNRRAGMSPAKEVDVFREGLASVKQCTMDVVEGVARDGWLERTKILEEKGVNADWAKRLSMPDNLFSGLGIVESVVNSEASVESATAIFFMLLDKLNLSWFATQLSEVNVETYWQALARESYIDDLEAQLRRLTIAILKNQEETLEMAFDHWMEKNAYLVNRWKAMVNEVESAQGTDYAMFSVALRELIDLTQATEFS